MQFNVAQLLKQPIGATRIFDLSEDIEGMDPGIVPLSPLEGSLKLLRTHSGILVTGQLEATLEVVCNRCLEPVEEVITVDVEESFRPLTDVDTGRFIMADEYEGQAEELVDGALLIDDHHILDAREIIRQNIFLSMPMIPGCVYDDPENCPNFAIRLEEIAEVHKDLEDDPQSDIDPRWAALLNLQEQGASEKEGEETAN